MKIVLITPQLSMGGAEKMVCYLAQGLHRRGEQVTVCARDGIYALELKNAGIEVRNLPPGSKSRWWQPALWFELRRILTGGRFDVIHVQTVPLLLMVSLICLFGGIRAREVLTLHGSPAWKLWLANPLLKLWPVEICTVSRKLARTLGAIYIPNAVEFSADRNGLGESFVSAANKYEIKGETLQVVIVARLVKEKGIDHWLKAAHVLQLRGHIIHTIIAGDGPERVHLERLSVSLQVPVTFLGWVKSPSGIMAKGDLLVLPSRREGEPLALLEAMACGLPVVATRVGGVTGLLQDGNGILVESSCRGLVAGIQKFLALSVAEKAEMTDRARDFVRGRTWERCVDAYLNIYRGGENEATIGGVL